MIDCNNFDCIHNIFIKIKFLCKEQGNFLF